MCVCVCARLVFNVFRWCLVNQTIIIKIAQCKDAVIVLHASYWNVKARYFLYMHQLAIGAVFTQLVNKTYNIQLNFPNWNTFLRAQMNNNFF